MGTNRLIRNIFSFKGPSCPSALNNAHKIQLCISDFLFAFSEGDVLCKEHSICDAMVL